MIIRHRGIHHTRFDAPFCGALISSISCDHGCTDCINEHLKSDPHIIHQDSNDILDIIRSNPFNEGIILGGLEWTLQKDEMLHLIQLALSYDLQVILYTHHTEDSLLNLIPELYDRSSTGDYLFKGLYIKYGEYDTSKLSSTYSSYDVPLASTNQYIVRLGDT